ncbi:MAG TPA: hypothetical protein VMQ76_06960 [Terracidiphilus sp.]|jgi:hypothetical protein|nr:hypothetical protein [Terracidiphilus sp.]
MRKLALIALLALPCYAQQPGLAKLQQAVTDLTAAVQRITQPVPSPGAGLLPGQTGLFAAFPRGQFGFPTSTPIAFVPVWTTSDPTNCPVKLVGQPETAPDGLQVSVAVPATLVPVAGQVCILTVTSPDGTGASSIVIPFTAPGQGPFGTNILSFQIPPQVITGYYVYQIAMPTPPAPGQSVARLEKRGR